MSREMAAVPVHVPDPVTTFLEDHYEPMMVNVGDTQSLGGVAIKKTLERFLAIADSIHDFGDGYRGSVVGSAEQGKLEAHRFLKNNRALLATIPNGNVLSEGYNHIENTNRIYFEETANIDWVNPVEQTISYDGIINAKDVATLVAEHRDKYTSIELDSSTFHISRVYDDIKTGGVGAIESQKNLDKIRDYIITFLFGAPNAICYFASDANPLVLGKILKSSTTARGIIFPQTIADSAPTSFGSNLTSHQSGNEFYFPNDAGHRTRFTSKANAFTYPFGFSIHYDDGDEYKNYFSRAHPVAWKQVITGPSPGSKTAILQYSTTEKEGASLNQLLELQVKTRSSGSDTTPPNVEPSTGGQMKLSTRIGDIYPAIKNGVVDPPRHSLFMDLKRCGDQDQCLAVSYARRSLNNNIALITADITCALKNRCLDNPTIEHNGNRIRIYRSSLSAKIMEPIDISRLKYKNLKAEYDNIKNVVEFFCQTEDDRREIVNSFLGRLTVGNPKLDDISGYLWHLTAGGLPGCPGTGAGAVPVPAYLTINVDTSNETDINNAVRYLSATLALYKINLTTIIRDTSGGPNWQPKTLEFYKWFINNNTTPFDPTKIYLTMKYDPNITKPEYTIPAVSDNYYNLIGTLNKYDNQLRTWCDSFFDSEKGEQLYNENNIKYRDPASADELIGIIDRIYNSNTKELRGLHGSIDKNVLDGLWREAATLLMNGVVSPVAVFPTGVANISGAVDRLKEHINTALSGTTLLPIILPDAAAVAPAGIAARKRQRERGMRAEVKAAAAARTKRQAVATRASARLATRASARRGGARRVTYRRQRGGVMTRGKLNECIPAAVQGSGACITKIYMVDELINFIGYVAADFRVRLYEIYPGLDLFIQALQLKQDFLYDQAQFYKINAQINHGPPPDKLAQLIADRESFKEKENLYNEKFQRIKHGNNIKDYEDLISILSDYILPVDKYISTPLYEDRTEISKLLQGYKELFEDTILSKWSSISADNKPAACREHIRLINKIWALITGDDNCVIDKAGNISVVEATAATGASAAGGAGSVVEATAATSDGHHSAADENTIMTGASAAGGAGTNGSGITNFNNFITGMAFIYDLIMNIELKGRHISIFTSHVFKQPSYIKTLITLSLGIDLISDAGIYGVYDALDRFVGGIWGDASTAKRKRSDRSEGDGGEDDGGEGDGDEGDGARPSAKRARVEVAGGAGSDGGNGDDTNLGGGAYPPHRHRRTKRRYSAQQYRKRTKTARRRRR